MFVARETGINRAASERLVQAETLAAMLNLSKSRTTSFLAGSFFDAWRNVLLYDEHTWGPCWYGVTNFDVPSIQDQFNIKLAFAADGDLQSRRLLADVLSVRGNKKTANAVDVFNTSSWPRTDLVVLSKDLSAAGDDVTDRDGKAVPCQRLSSGELAFLAKDVPPLAGRRYMVVPGQAQTPGSAKAEGTTLTTPLVTVCLDPASGAIASLRSTAVDAELSDTKSGIGLDRYYYVECGRVKEPQQAGPAKITVKEHGPLVASLLVESAAPGCVQFTREIRVVDGLDHVDIVNVLNKKEVRQKESVHLGFAFNVPHGAMRIDIPWAVFRPEIDQLPGACKQWLPVGRWADVSNRHFGVTWATLDAPLLEVGAIRADKLNNVSTDPNAWLARLEPSQTLYSYVMNNHWDTNFLPFQSGPTTFRYSLLPHKAYDAVAAQRFGMERSQPLVAAPARGAAPNGRPFLQLDTPDVIVASIKPSEDRKAIIVRLFEVGGRAANVALNWSDKSRTIWLSNLAEEHLASLRNGPVAIPAYGLVTLRAE